MATARMVAQRLPAVLDQQGVVETATDWAGLMKTQKIAAQ